MAKTDKLLAAMRDNPRADWTMADLETLATRYGVAARKSGGSHVVFEHPASAEAISVPARRPIKPPYIRRFVVLIDRVKGS